MKQSTIIILLFVALSGCKPEVPGAFIQPEEMAEILYDIHVADGYTNVVPSVDSAKKVSAAYYKGIFKKHGVDSALYNQSLKFYGDNPEVFSKVYVKLVAELTQEKGKLIKADSLDNVKLAKKARIKFKADSTKIADSIAKTPAFIKEKLKKTADSIKADVAKKAALKKADSIKKVAESKKNVILKKTQAQKKTDSIRRKSGLRRIRN
ncbi:DUF4296 domain-containing protein [Pedobacter sp. MC2016-14]|uniref:DUF4296 domain-containing protein n=1 Tax=Pedobacter sp. MC2016-14 TaxID=2897327 RepID=UPI001E44A607|nr:DUF4296 domain-containing protein [Pedobacter sp. MC2016-14]MCD0488919.1 DUF4296 domain-containing protein [Pedobacter sp. MC2016-14]